MKKLLIAALLAVTVFTSAFAGETKSVNLLVKNTFNADYPGASGVSWTMGSNFAKATFKIGKQKMEAFYEINGDKIGTSRTVDVEDLPVSAKRTIAKKYSEFIGLGGFTVKEAIRFERPDEGAYFVSMENENEAVIFKITDTGLVSVADRMKK